MNWPMIYNIAALATIVGTVITLFLIIRKKKKEPKFEIEVKITSGVDYNNKHNQDALLNAINELIRIDGNIKITKVEQRSLSLDLLNYQNVSTFFKRFNRFEAQELFIEDAWLPGELKEAEIIDNEKIYKIPETKTSPLVIVDRINGKLLFKGRLVVEDSFTYFEPILDCLDNYLSKTTNKRFLAEFDIEYLNSGSKKFLVNIFNSLSKFENAGNEIKIKWYYEEDDEEILVEGEYFRSISNCDGFQLIEK